MPRPTQYPHQKYMKEEGIKINDLPNNIQSDLNDFEAMDKSIPGYNDSLEDESLEIKKEIEEWLDEEIHNHNCPCANPKLAVLVNFYVDGNINVVTKKDLLATKKFVRKDLENGLGFTKKTIKVSDDFHLEHDKKTKNFKIINNKEGKEEGEKSEDKTA